MITVAIILFIWTALILGLVGYFMYLLRKKKTRDAEADEAFAAMLANMKANLAERGFHERLKQEKAEAAAEVLARHKEREEQEK